MPVFINTYIHTCGATFIICIDETGSFLVRILAVFFDDGGGLLGLRLRSCHDGLPV